MFPSRNIRNFFKPSFPKAVFCVSLVLSLVMVKYRHVERKPSRHTRTALAKKVSPMVAATAPIAPIIEAPVAVAPKISAEPTLPKMSPLTASLLTKLGQAVSTPKKVVVTNKVTRKISKKVVAPKVVEPTEAWYEARWSETWDDTDAVETHAPIDELIAAALNETAPTADYSPEFRLSGLQFDGIQDQTGVVTESKLFVTEGVIQKNGFEDLRASFTTIKEAAEIESPIEAPKRSTNSKPSTVAGAPTEPSLVVPTISASLADTQTPKMLLAQAEVTESPEVTSDTNEASTTEAEEEADEPTIAKTNPKIDPSVLAPIQAGISLPEILTTQKTEKKNSQVSTTTSSVTTQLGVAKEKDSGSSKGPELTGRLLDRQRQVVKTETAKEKERDARREEESNNRSWGSPRDSGMIYGKIHWDSSVEQWLAKNKGHIELRLQRHKSTDPQDTIFITEYQFPAKTFEFDARNLRGPYQLIAALYTSKETSKVAQVRYSKLITAENYKENILFAIGKPELDKALNTVQHWASTAINLTATVFEGASGGHRQPKTIPGASVTVVGFPELGSVRSDAEGNIRIPNIPTRSELILEIHMLGYYSARYTVPTFESNVYVPLYLIEKDKVDTITKYFTKKEQSPSKGLILGRVFDPETRAPMKGEQLALSYRKGHGLYFGALPDVKLKETTETGLFGFFNVEASFRTVFRPNDKAGMLLNVRPSFAQYVEFGRGGKRNLKGRLFDPFNNLPVEGKIRFVGGDGNEVIADETGKFEFSGVDLPTGVITIEVQADGYPTTWHTIPWNTVESQKVHQIFLLEKELVLESQKRMAKVPYEKGLGAIVGGADPAFFAKKNGCIIAEVEDGNGKIVESAKGPFYLTSKNDKQKVCLSAQRPGFSFYNLLAGEYLLKWKNEKGTTLRSHVVRVGKDRVSVVVN